VLIEECSAIIKNKIPKKPKVLGGFIIPCHIGDRECSRALCDHSSSISLMPYFIFRKLGLVREDF
jgi:hypothetical protein